MKTQTEVKRILDYGYYCDLVELNSGDLRIDTDDERIDKLKEVIGCDDDTHENEALGEMFEQFNYLEFIPNLSYDERFGALTNSCAIYYGENKRLWWYPNYQIHNIFEKLIEDRQVTFSLAE